MAFVGFPASVVGGASSNVASSNVSGGFVSQTAPVVHSLRRSSAIIHATPAPITRHSVTMEVGEGDPTPFFKDAPLTGGASLSSEDLSSGVSVIAFYPRDCTSGCTTVAKELTGMLPDITAMGVKVYGCSPDSLASHDNFIETEELGFPLISDESGAVLDAFSAWKAHPTFGKVVNRSTFIIKDGKIASAMRGVSSGGHAANVFDALKAL